MRYFGNYRLSIIGLTAPVIVLGAVAFAIIKLSKKLKSDRFGKKTVLILCTLCVIVSCVLSFCTVIFVNNRRIHKIDPDKVEKITFWADGIGLRGEQELNEQDAETIIIMYNESKYSGKGIGDGGTPEFGITVYFTNGNTLRLSQFHIGDRDFEMSYTNANGKKEDWFYVKNQDIYNYVFKMVTDGGK